VPARVRNRFSNQNLAKVSKEDINFVKSSELPKVKIWRKSFSPHLFFLYGMGLPLGMSHTNAFYQILRANEVSGRKSGGESFSPHFALQNVAQKSFGIFVAAYPFYYLYRILLVTSYDIIYTMVKITSKFLSNPPLRIYLCSHFRIKNS